jgi:hypothetical protein
VKRLLALLLVFVGGCGGFVFQSDTGSITSFSGLVTIVHLSSMANHGTFITVTVVTLAQSGISNSLTFCGDVVDQFPVDTTVRVNFVPASPCSTVQVVIIL